MTTTITDFIVVTAGDPPEHDHGSWSQHPDRKTAVRLARHFDGDRGLVFKRVQRSGGQQTWTRIILHKISRDPNPITLADLSVD